MTPTGNGGPINFLEHTGPMKWNLHSIWSNGTGTKSDLAKYYDEIKRFDFYIGEVVQGIKSTKRGWTIPW